MITKLLIKGLYGLYDYDIDLKKHQPVLVLTGPNGFGKTTILKVIHNVVSCNFWYFNLLQFSFIRIHFSEGYALDIQKNAAISDISKLSHIKESIFTFYKKSVDSEESKVTSLLSEFALSTNYILRQIRRSSLDYRTVNSIAELDFEDYFNRNYDFYEDSALPEASEKLTVFLRNYKSLYIKEQRLQYEKLDERYGRYLVNKYNVDKISDDLHKIFQDTQNEYVKISQQIDSQFIVKILQGNKEHIPKNKFEETMKKWDEILQAYKKYGLNMDLSLDFHSIDMERYDMYSEVLSQYLLDVGEKILGYKDLFMRLQEFQNFLNEKGLSNKNVSLNVKDGLVVADIRGNNIPLHKLSSGEQNLIILYFYLLFKAQPGMWICLDEPEISMHVAWQESMLKDIKCIAEEYKLNILISTHSLDFINEDWDDCLDLFEMSKNGR